MVQAFLEGGFRLLQPLMVLALKIMEALSCGVKYIRVSGAIGLYAKDLRPRYWTTDDKP
jgi:hypothetical protein